MHILGVILFAAFMAYLIEGILKEEREQRESDKAFVNRLTMEPIEYYPPMAPRPPAKPVTVTPRKLPAKRMPILILCGIGWACLLVMIFQPIISR